MIELNELNGLGELLAKSSIKKIKIIPSTYISSENDFVTLYVSYQQFDSISRSLDSRLLPSVNPDER